jgi:hypothetical protein
MSGGTQVGRVVTHRGQEFEEKHEKVTSKDQQEIYRGIFHDRVEKALHTTNTHKTSMSRRIYDNEEGRDVFSEGVGRCDADAERREGTYHTLANARKISLWRSPSLEYTELVLVERKVWDYHHFRNWGLPRKLPSKTGEKGHTRS